MEIGEDTGFELDDGTIDLLLVLVKEWLKVLAVDESRPLCMWKIGKYKIIIT